MKMVVVLSCALSILFFFCPLSGQSVAPPDNQSQSAEELLKQRQRLEKLTKEINQKIGWNWLFLLKEILTAEKTIPIVPDTRAGSSPGFSLFDLVKLLPYGQNEFNQVFNYLWQIITTETGGGGEPPNQQPGVIQVTPAQITFNSQSEQTLEQWLVIQNTGGLPFNWDLSKNIPWLSVFPAEGILPQLMAQQVLVTVNTTGLETGQYSGQLTIQAQGAINSPVVVNVILNVYSSPPPTEIKPPKLSVSPTEMTFNAPGGSLCSITYNSKYRWKATFLEPDLAVWWKSPWPVAVELPNKWQSATAKSNSSHRYCQPIGICGIYSGTIQRSNNNISSWGRRLASNC